MIRPQFIPLAAASLLATTSPNGRAEESAPSPCGKSFIVSGEINHFKKPKDIVVDGATKPEMFDEEIYGKTFSVYVPGLPKGRYTIEIYLAEVYQRSPGARVMDISVGEQKLVEGLDILTTAGFSTAYIVTGEVDHEDDSINGPLSILFQARKNEAKVNAIVVKDSAGNGVACVQAKDLVTLQDLKARIIPQIKEPAIYLDADQPVERRVSDLIRRMSLGEKVAQLMDNAPRIERLSVPGYNYWNECLHGVARAGNATVFPQAIGMAATWNPSLLQKVADVIATEARAKNNEERAKDPTTTARYFGLTFWTPNINIFRDPRWGRGHETYGEDPYLTSRLGVAFIKGLQGDDPHYIKALACAKHFAVHSGPEKLRHTFDVAPSARDLYETYLPQFEAAVREANVGAVMSAYNALYGVPAPASKLLLTDLLRKQWGFNGHVVSDCGAIGDIWSHHHYVQTREEGVAASLKAGTDLECGGSYSALVQSINKKYLTEGDVDIALKRTLESRFQLGLFDSPERCAYLRIPSNENDTPSHSELATETARESIVLLKNDGVLPLKKSAIKRIALIGPNADSIYPLLGNYHGKPSNPVTLRRGLLEEVGKDVEVVYIKGCPLATEIKNPTTSDNPEFHKALKDAETADVIIFAGGLDAGLEGEEMDTRYIGFDRGDRVTIELPSIQSEMLRALHKTGKPIVFVNCSGSAVAMPWEAENIPAIIQAWYPGQNGGTAVADVLFGKYNPSGRLPVTFYRATQDLPPFEDYNMANRTYRYFGGKTLFPFGHGLSYTKFEYGQVVASASKVNPKRTFSVSLPVKNAGEYDGDEVVQVYVRHLNSKVPQPIHSLAAFRRVHITKGSTATVDFEVPASALRYWDEATGAYVVPKGEFELQVGSSAENIKGAIRLNMMDSKG